MMVMDVVMMMNKMRKIQMKIMNLIVIKRAMKIQKKCRKQTTKIIIMNKINK